MNIDKLFTFDNAVKLTGITYCKLRSLITKDLINYYKFGGRIFFDLIDVLEIKSIADLNLSPSQIKEIREFFESNKLSKSLSDKRLIICDKKIYHVNSLDDITQLTSKGKGQKIIGQILLPDLYSELHHKAKILQLENYSKKFKLLA
jgi:hypothetical protein